MTIHQDASQIPGPPPARLLGSQGNFIKFLRDPVGYMRALYNNYGDVAALVKGSHGMIFAFGPQFNQQILSNPATFYCTSLMMPGPQNSAQRRLSDGVFSMNNEVALSRRRLLMPAFHKRCISEYRDTMVDLTQTTLDRWSVGKPIDIFEEMRKLTLQISGRLLFGLEQDSPIATVANMIDLWMKRSTSVPVRLLRYDWPGTPYRRMLLLAERLEREILAIADQKRRQSDRANDVLSLLLQAHDESGLVSDSELVGQTNLVLLASYETTTTALTWTLFLLAQHPQIAQNLYDELKSILRGDPPTIEQIGKLTLLDAVIKESLRILPPVIYNTRTAVKPFALGPHLLNTGATVGFSHYITHHLSELFPDPEKFMPERWSSCDPSPYEYLPFGAGSRTCIGAAFAVMLTKIVVATILQRFSLTVIADSLIDRKGLITLAPKFGMPMLLQSTPGQFARSRVRGSIHEMVDLN